MPMRDQVRARLTRRNMLAVVVAAVVFIAAGLLDGLYQRVLGEESWGYSFENVDAEIGEWVNVDGMRARVLDYRTAYRVVGDFDDGMIANGIYLIVTVQAERPEAGMDDLAELWVRQNGLLLESVGGWAPSPTVGFRQTTQVYFDVDPDHLVGTQFTAYQKEVTFRYRTRAVVDLGIDEARAAELRAVDPEEEVTVKRPPMEAIP
ncbi:hypothetical protein AADG42_18285 [Ammonicoccus fulvus]|uniref:Uncharacterized protein n=1 Tax=Ammonicoccus fulvus TaxID=3138240 RepID=A0ABZ3FWP7_9ACTN